MIIRENPYGVIFLEGDRAHGRTLRLLVRDYPYNTGLDQRGGLRFSPLFTFGENPMTLPPRGKPRGIFNIKPSRCGM